MRQKSGGFARLAAALLIAVTVAGPASPAVSAGAGDLAQVEEMQPGTGRTGSALDARKSASRFRYLMLGYGLIWVSLGVYLLSLHRGVGRVGREIEELKARLEESGGGAQKRGPQG